MSDWYAEAACRGMDPDMFFPERGASLEPARAVCRTCPVVDPCREAGMTERFGIWGALSERERRRMKAYRRRRAGLGSAGHGTEAGHARHIRQHEKPCDACREAKNAAANARKQAQRGA